MEKYCQLCVDEAGAYVVAHSPDPELDLVVFSIPKEEEMRQNWKALFGNTPEDWSEDLSVLSHFQRGRWAKLTKQVEKWR